MKNIYVFLLVFLVGGISCVFIFKTFFADGSKIEVIEEVVNKDYDYYLNKER